MAAIPVEPVVTTFEHFETARCFDLVYAAAAWHWTEPATRWVRTVEMLVPGGVLALFGSPAEPQDPALVAAVDEIEKQVLPNDDPAVVHPWSMEEMAAAAIKLAPELALRARPAAGSAYSGFQGRDVAGSTRRPIVTPCRSLMRSSQMAFASRSLASVGLRRDSGSVVS